WRRAPDAVPRGLYLDGPPGVGKTHLMAAAFNAAPEPRLFVTFDELSAAAGTLGMERLSGLLASQRLVCIDEIDLRDPASIMLTVSLLRAMLAGSPRIIATANADPLGTSARALTADDFRRELGEIASAFAIVPMDGRDRRLARALAPRPTLPAAGRVLETTWEALLAFLRETHPMYDAAWLDCVDLIRVDRLAPLADADQALRFVRFIDRVYDRDVRLTAAGPTLAPEQVLQPLLDDGRFVLHVARCRSRLIELLGIAVADPTEARAAD
ncbi:MAG: AFG1/ZapE family ATPase, partial [Sphaerobacter sp.]|nr:AFG1/ZapE family ATPase [Sphaerobacter sp.]